MRDMSTDHEAYHVDFEEDDSGQKIAILAPNAECPYCLEEDTPSTVEEVYAALRILVGDVAEGPGAIWPPPELRDFRNLARGLVWRALQAAEDPNLRERVLALGRGE